MIPAYLQTMYHYSLLAWFRHLQGKPQSQAQICAHWGTYTVRHSLNCAPIKSQRITCEWNRRVKAVNSLSRPRLYLQIADCAKSELTCVWCTWNMKGNMEIVLLSSETKKKKVHVSPCHVPAPRVTKWCEGQFEPRKFKGGICCGGHLAITYGGELLYL